MPRRSQEKLRGLCLLLLAAGALACGEEEPAPVDPPSSLPLWADCKNWRRTDGSCDQAVLLADYEECLRTEGIPDMQRLSQHEIGRLTVGREGQRKTIVCIEKRSWRMTKAGFQHLPGRPTPPPS